MKQQIFCADKYLSAQDVARITARIAKDHDISHEQAEKILNGTIEFLELSAKYPGQRFVPSKEIDKGWHTLLLYTRTYRKLCQSLGAQFIDHEPSDGDVSVPRGGALNTVAFMQQNKILFDTELWPEKSLADCEADPCNCTGCDEWVMKQENQVVAA
ncbi:MAG TPA: hypothetical protein VJJ78_03455 [Candidatus Saccharimonadales bacterium]|nr:hypothetical protein [Candidatus Saccharimonadales bacterium]HLD85910.1 hypothetical protein [Patescibacteria group bacterium]